MNARRKPQSVYQHDPLVAPSNWKGEERQFAIRLSQLIDQLFARKTSVSSETVKDLVDSMFAEQKRALLLEAHPVGSLYVSEEETNPAAIFGGEWERIKDKFLLAAGSSYAAGATGGEAKVVLTETQMPKHSHTEVYPTSITNVRPIGSGTMDKAYTDEVAITNGTYKSLTTFPNHASAGESNPIYPIHTMFSGGNQSHNNMPPYLAVYVWKRIA